MNKLLIITALAVIGILGIQKSVKAEAEQPTSIVQKNENIQTVHYKKGKQYRHHRHHGKHRHHHSKNYYAPNILIPTLIPVPGYYYYGPQYRYYYW